MAPRTEIKPTPGYGGGGDAFIRLTQWTSDGSGLDYDCTEIAEYTLRFLPDTNEIALIKSTPNGVGSNLNEIVYSEEVI